MQKRLAKAATMAGAIGNWKLGLLGVYSRPAGLRWRLPLITIYKLLNLWPIMLCPGHLNY